MSDPRPPDASLELFAERLKLAMAYTNQIIVEADGYPMMMTAASMRTLLVNTFLAGQDALASAAVEREPPQRYQRADDADVQTPWPATAVLCTCTVHSGGAVAWNPTCPMHRIKRGDR